MKKKTAYTWVIILIIFISIGYCTYRITQPSSDNTGGELIKGGHWHAKIDVLLCGEQKNLPFNLPGQSHRGLPTLHSHDDNKMHIETEGKVVNKKDITLGKFMDAVGVPFSATQLMDKKNGDSCPGTTPGSVKMYVNGQPNTLFRDYVPNLVPDEQMDTIKIEFS